MKPLQHAKISAHKYGGRWEDYIDIHEFFDQTKEHVADMRHRAILHNSFGIYLAQRMFGIVRVNSDGREYSIRDVAEQHVLEDLGTIPSLASIINAIGMNHLKWLGGPNKRKKTTLSIKYPQSEEQSKESCEEASRALENNDELYASEHPEAGPGSPLEPQEKATSTEDEILLPKKTFRSIMRD